MKTAAEHSHCLTRTEWNDFLVEEWDDGFTSFMCLFCGAGLYVTDAAKGYRMSAKHRCKGRDEKPQTERRKFI